MHRDVWDFFPVFTKYYWVYWKDWSLCQYTPSSDSNRFYLIKYYHFHLSLRCLRGIYLPLVCRDLVLCSLTFIFVAAVHLDTSCLSFPSYIFLSPLKQSKCFWRSTLCSLYSCSSRQGEEVLVWFCVIHRSLLTYSAIYYYCNTPTASHAVTAGRSCPCRSFTFSTNIKKCFGKSFPKALFLWLLLLHLQKWLMWHCHLWPQYPLLPSSTGSDRHWHEKGTVLRS